MAGKGTTGVCCVVGVVCVVSVWYVISVRVCSVLSVHVLWVHV